MKALLQWSVGRLEQITVLQVQSVVGLAASGFGVDFEIGLDFDRTLAQWENERYPCYPLSVDHNAACLEDVEGVVAGWGPALEAKAGSGLLLEAALKF